MLRYGFADLCVESDLVLPELPLGYGSPECVIRMRAHPVALCGEIRWQRHWRATDGTITLSCGRDGDRHLLRFPGLADFTVDTIPPTAGVTDPLPARRIGIHPLPGVPEVTLRHLLLDQVLPRVRSLGSGLVLHAGAVLVPDGVVGFLGESGYGKSTLCGALAAGGATLLSDDCIVLRPDGAEGLEVLAGYTGLRLHPDSLFHLYGETDAEPVAHYTRKRRTRAEGMSLRSGSPLRRLYLIDPPTRHTRTVSVSAVSPRGAFVGLLRNSFQLELTDPAHSHRLFALAGRVAAKANFRRLTYPRDLSFLPTVRETILGRATGQTRRRVV